MSVFFPIIGCLSHRLTLSICEILHRRIFQSLLSINVGHPKSRPNAGAGALLPSLLNRTSERIPRSLSELPYSGAAGLENEYRNGQLPYGRRFPAGLSEQSGLVRRQYGGDPTMRACRESLSSVVY